MTRKERLDWEVLAKVGLPPADAARQRGVTPDEAARELVAGAQRNELRLLPNADSAPARANMDTFLDTQAAVESIRQVYDGTSDRPNPEWVRGQCPQCGDDLVSNCYYVGGRGYLIGWQCWASLGENPACNFQKVL